MAGGLRRDGGRPNFQVGLTSRERQPSAALTQPSKRQAMLAQDGILMQGTRKHPTSFKS